MKLKRRQVAPVSALAALVLAELAASFIGTALGWHPGAYNVFQLYFSPIGLGLAAFSLPRWGIFVFFLYVLEWKVPNRLLGALGKGILMVLTGIWFIDSKGWVNPSWNLQVGLGLMLAFLVWFTYFVQLKRIKSFD